MEMLPQNEDARRGTNHSPGELDPVRDAPLRDAPDGVSRRRRTGRLARLPPRDQGHRVYARSRGAARIKKSPTGPICRIRPRDFVVQNAQVACALRLAELSRWLTQRPRFAQKPPPFPSCTGCHWRLASADVPSEYPLHTGETPVAHDSKRNWMRRANAPRCDRRSWAEAAPRESPSPGPSRTRARRIPGDRSTGTRR